MGRKRRWGDNDRHFGPFTFAFRERWRPLAAVLCSGSSDPDDGGACHLRLQAFGATLICELPAIVKPWRHWVDTSRYDWSTTGGYWDEHSRQYGFSLSEGHLHVKLGQQTGDSSTTKDWGCFLPWTQWRQIAHRIYDAYGRLAGEVAMSPWDERSALIEAVPKLDFQIADHDGEVIRASAYIEEREWRLGTGWFKWLGYLWPRKCLRSLDIQFSKEVGRDKGSWKGGMLGHGIEMLPGETAERAFRRYCEQEHRAKHGRYRISFLRLIAPGDAGATVEAT